VLAGQVTLVGSTMRLSIFIKTHIFSVLFMTKKLFYDDPYLMETNATVEKKLRNKVYLDQTIFFPTKGGQDCDKGSINDIDVVEVREEGSAKIVHILEKEPKFRKGDTVILRVDWERRYRMMKLHSATHIVLKLLTARVGKEMKTIGSHITEDKARLDFEYNGSLKDAVEDVEEMANKLLKKDIDIVNEEDEAELGSRVWLLSEWKVLCAGLHVRNTREIGEISLKRKNLGAGKERVEVRLS